MAGDASATERRDSEKDRKSVPAPESEPRRCETRRRSSRPASSGRCASGMRTVAPRAANDARRRAIAFVYLRDETRAFASPAFGTRATLSI